MATTLDNERELTPHERQRLEIGANVGLLEVLLTVVQVIRKFDPGAAASMKTRLVETKLTHRSGEPGIFEEAGRHFVLDRVLDQLS